MARRNVHSTPWALAVNVLVMACSDPVGPGVDSGSTQPADTSGFQDTSAEAVVYEQIDDTHYWVTNGTSGARMMVELVRPSAPASSTRATILLVPGGRTPRTVFTEDNQAQYAANFFDVNYLAYDPEGRGDSEGTEDDGGFVQQDGLFAVLRFAASGADPSIDTGQIGVVSSSFGVTIAAGMFARHAAAQDIARFLVDFEGPADRNDTGSCADVVGHLAAVDCSDEEFWSEREARAFIDDVGVPYARMQTLTDHAQPDVDHAAVMLNEAFYGAAPSVALNLVAVTSPVQAISADQLLPDTADRLQIQTATEAGLAILAGR